jgi:glycosyltransferase involved in cell wall biosynthesis
MKKALYIVTSMDTGGAETVLMKYYRALDKSLYQMDFCVSSDAPGFYDAEIESMGGRIVHTVKKTEAGPIASFERLKQIAREGGYCCAMRSSQHSLSSLDLLAMRAGGVPKTIFRSSNTGTVSGSTKETLLHNLFKPLVKIAATDYAAPSTEAGKYMFGENAVSGPRFHVMKNALNLADFAFDSDARAEIRAEFDISADAFVVGHIGRFNQQKNHFRLIEVFAEIANRKPDAVLLLVGKGERRPEVETYIEELGLSDRVVFAGIRRDANRIYSAMDVFVFPSLYEGLPNVIVEAQANGLPCVISDSITEEVLISKNVVAKNLNECTVEWANVSCSLNRLGTKESSEELKAAGYDIHAAINDFVKLVFE